MEGESKASMKERKNIKRNERNLKKLNLWVEMKWKHGNV